MEKTLPSGIFKNRLREELRGYGVGRDNEGEGREEREEQRMREGLAE